MLTKKTVEGGELLCRRTITRNSTTFAACDLHPAPINRRVFTVYRDFLRQDKTISVDGLRCILYARIYIPYMRTILYHYTQTGRPPVPISTIHTLLRPLMI